MMRSPSLFGLLLYVHNLVGISAYNFVPETLGIQYDALIKPLPAQYNISTSQNQFGASYWSSSFIHGSDNHDYLLISHALISQGFDLYRASILDITNPTLFNQWSIFESGSNFTSFHLGTDNYYIGLASQDELGPINTWSTNDVLSFNLTFNLSAPLILNAGVGTFQYTTEATTGEWSMPAGVTTGFFIVNNKTITVDPARSLTWYDRQFGIGGSVANWTWFELHVNTPAGGHGEKLSIWFYPQGKINKGFVTVSDRNTPGVQTVIPAQLIEGNRLWTSPFGGAYHQDWTIKFVDGTSLSISSIKDDQELADPKGALRTYEGFVNVTGISKQGPISGYGLVEISLPQP